MNGRALTLFDRKPRGGAALWHTGNAGQILTDEFFGAPPAPPAGLQAVRFDNVADRLDMPAAALPSGSGGWTVAGWFRIVNDRNAVTTLWSLDGIFSSSWHSLRTDASGTALKLNQSGTDVLSIASLTVGVWYFLAVRKDAAGNVKAYVGTEAGGALTTVTGSVTNITTYSGDGYVGGNAYGDWFDGRAWGLRLWDADLSDAEIDAEFVASAEARTSNRRARWPLGDATTPGTDASGNARDLTNAGGGAWALEDGPTLPGGGGGPVTVDVGRALADTLARAPSIAKAEDVGRATATALGRAPTIAKTEDVGRAAASTTARAPTIAKAEDVGRATASATARAPSSLKTEDVGRATAGSTARAPAIAKAIDVGRALASVTLYTPEVRPAIVLVGRVSAGVTLRAPGITKTEDVSRALATSTARSPTEAKAITVGRATSTATLYTPTVDAGIPDQFVDLATWATATATVRRPSVDAPLQVARVTARAIRPLDVIYNRERRGSAGWRSWRRA